MAPVAPRAPAHTVFTPSADQTAVHHLRLMVQRVMRRSPSDVHLYVVCGEVAFPVSISAPAIPDFQPGDCLFAEYPRGDNPLNTTFTAIYPAHLRPKKETAMPELIPTSGNSLTMSSREIAELTGSTHDNVLKTVRNLAAKGVVSGNETPYTHPQNGQTYTEFRLNYRDTMVVVSGYSVELRARIIDRWQELEAKAAQPALNPASLSRMQLIELAMQAEQERLALEEKVSEQAPKVEALERFAEHDGRYSTRNTAKLLGVPERKLIAWLLTHDWYYRDHSGRLCAKSGKIADGYLDTIPIDIPRSDGIQTVPQPVVTQRGLVRLGVLLAKDGLLPRQTDMEPIRVPQPQQTARLHA